MSDREKVINGLECCREMDNPPGYRFKSCELCPYHENGCARKLKEDALELMKEPPQWHPFDPLEPDDTGLNDHNFYLVTVKGFGTPMKAMYHIDMPFGFLPPPTKDFDPYDVVAWCELPDNMDEEVKR